MSDPDKPEKPDALVNGAKREEDTVNIRRRNRLGRDTEANPQQLVKAAGLMGDQFRLLQAQVAGFKKILFVTLAVAVLALVSAGSVLVAGSRGPSSVEVQRVLERVVTPLERLERVLDRLDRKLDKIEK